MGVWVQLFGGQWCGSLDVGAQGGAGGWGSSGWGFECRELSGGWSGCSGGGPEAMGLGLQMQGLRFSGVGFGYGVLEGF